MPKTLMELRDIYGDNPPGVPMVDVIDHLRETLATLKAVEALADGWSASPALVGCELREVLNGKR